MGPRQCLCERDEPSKLTLKCARKDSTFEEEEEEEVLDKPIYPKRARKLLTLEEKMRLIDMHKLGWKYSLVGKVFGLGDSTVRYIVKSEDRIRRRLSKGPSPAKKVKVFRRRTLSKTEKIAKQVTLVKRRAVSEMEKALLVFIQEEYKKGNTLPRQTIRLKAKALYEKMITSECELFQSTNADPNSLALDSNETPDPNLPNPTILSRNFKASVGWFYGFMTRHRLHIHKPLKENWSADHKTVPTFPQVSPGDFEGFTAEEQVTEGAHRTYDVARRMECTCSDEETFTSEYLCPGLRRIKKEITEVPDQCDVPINDNGSMDMIQPVTGDENYTEDADVALGKALTPENLCQAMRIATQLKQFFYSIDPSMERAFKVMAGIDQVLTPYKTILDEMICKRSKLPTTRFFQQTQQSDIPAASVSSSLNPS